MAVNNYIREVMDMFDKEIKRLFIILVLFLAIYIILLCGFAIVIRNPHTVFIIGIIFSLAMIPVEALFVWQLRKLRQRKYGVLYSHFNSSIRGEFLAEAGQVANSLGTKDRILIWETYPLLQDYMEYPPREYDED